MSTADDAPPSPPTRETSFQSNSTAGIGIGDLPTEGSAIQLSVESPESRGKKRWIIPAVILLIAVLLATVIGLAVGLTQKNNGNSASVNDQLGGGGPALAPTDSPISVSDVQSWITSQGYSPGESFRNTQTPQSRAAAFMAEDGMEVPTESSSAEESYQWMERYVVALFYYAMNGPNWPSQLNFLDKSRPTCAWFVLVNIVGFGESPLGASCEANVMKVDALQIIKNNVAGSIPSEVGLLTEMQYIVLQQNEGITGELPDSMQSFDKLLFFDCVRCSLSGSIPSWIGNWQSVRKIAVTENQFVGSLPTSMGSLQTLRELAIDDNSFTGDLSVMEPLVNLQYLFAENNGFVDTIGPTFMQSLDKLVVLDISDNEFAGQVPNHLMSNGALRVLDVHGNQLSSFPDTIPDNASVRFLAVHENPIAGSFPNSTITNLKDMLHLDLTSTEFSGTMPAVLGEMQKLTYLFLADTTFDAGPIPPAYQDLIFLKDFSVKHSARTGTIPSWLEKLDRTVLLDLDSNDFVGPIPTEIGGMVSLQFLMLNRNDLDGEIPTQLGLVISLQLLFLDHNSLTGDMSDICAATPNLQIAVADCGGATPAVTCTCCGLCCDPLGANGDENCNSRDSLAQYDPDYLSGYNRQGLYSLRHLNITDGEEEP